MSAPVSVPQSSNTLMDKPLKNKEEASTLLVAQNKRLATKENDPARVENTNSSPAVTLDIPQNVIKQSRHSAHPSKYLQDDLNTLNCLKSDWLEEAEGVIADRYGITGDGSDLTIVLENSHKPYRASTEFELGPDGKAYNESLHIAVNASLPVTLPKGGEGPYYDDRVITHEMVHAIMGRALNLKSMPVWFAEGTAEFIHGADERIADDLSHSGGDMRGATAMQNALGDGTDKTWVSDSLHYSSATMAVRYLHKQIEAAGHPGGIKDLLGDLRDNPSENLDQALSHVSNYANIQAFITDYVKNGNGKQFIHDLDISGEFQSAVNGGDTGGIGGSSVDNGPVQTSESVIPDINHPTDTPLKHFHIIWPTLGTHVDIAK